MERIDSTVASSEGESRYYYLSVNTNIIRPEDTMKLAIEIGSKLVGTEKLEPIDQTIEN